METRTCNTCGETKPLDEFSKHAYSRDGRRTQCKECLRKADRKYRNRPDMRQKRAEYQRQTRHTRKDRYGDRYKGRYDQSKYRETLRDWHKRNPLAASAYRKLHRAIRNGVLPKASECTCVKCGNPAEHYHHHSGYDKEHALDVIPLCCSCHQIIHG